MPEPPRNIDTVALTGILAYDVTPAIKIYGGLRAQRMKADGAVPFLGGYTIETDADIGYGYMLGAAWQKPELAMRVALTYRSAIEQDFDTVEFGTINSTLHVETPQSVALEFQSGIAADTLVFGSVRWVDWPQFEIDPTNYPLDVPMVEYEEAWTTWTLGVGRQFTDRLAGAFEVAYEPATDTILTLLGPVDGGVVTTASLSYDVRVAHAFGRRQLRLARGRRGRDRHPVRGRPPHGGRPAPRLAFLKRKRPAPRDRTSVSSERAGPVLRGPAPSQKP